VVVAGIIKDIPQNSSLTFDLILPIDLLAHYWGIENPNFLNTWYNNAFTTCGLSILPKASIK
jgi:hypothetical protein